MTRVSKARAIALARRLRPARKVRGIHPILRFVVLADALPQLPGAKVGLLLPYRVLDAHRHWRRFRGVPGGQ